ncbi:MAG: radical SAM protein [Planctomycetes bacterium]|nr:radical SAM protein [Planctomycetota bacterium]
MAAAAIDRCRPDRLWISLNRVNVVKQLRVLSSLGRTLLRPAEPGYLILYVNNVCNLRCDMCLAWDQMQKKTDDMSLDEFVKLSRSFRNLVQLTLTGGEPTLNRDLPRIVEAFYRNSNTAKCTLVTNGTYVDKTLEHVREILDRCPHVDLVVTVSLDGTKEIHERIRGVEGCFDKSCTCLDRLFELRDSGHRRGHLSVNVTSVISKYNWNQIEDLYHFVRDRFKADGHAFLLARGTTKEADAKDVPLEAYRRMTDIIRHEENRSSQYLSLPLKGMTNAMRSVIDRVSDRDEYVIPCVAGRKLVEIYSNGDVIPCEIIEAKRDPLIGNVRDFDYDIVKLLQGRKAQEMRRFISNTKCRCTFECAMYASLAFNPMQYPRILAGLRTKNKDTDERSSTQPAAERYRSGVQPC